MQERLSTKEMSPSTNQRDATFDIMKGIGILLVITCHFFNWNHPLLGRSINSFHMPMFFMVAGYFSKSFISWKEAWTSIKKYARRLLPAFVFTQVFIILWAVLMALTKDEGWDQVIRQTLSLFWADPHGPYTSWGRLSIGVIWFLIALFVAKCLLLVISRLKSWSIPLSIILSIGAILLHRLFPYSIWCISLGLTALPFMTIGWWARNHKIPGWIIIVCIICWVLAILYSHLVMYDMDWGFFPLDFIGACGGSFCLYMICKFISKHLRFISKPLAVLGVWSLAVMCFHDLEMHCHLGNHFMALLPISVPGWGQYLFRYFIAIALAAIAVKTPRVKSLFV